MSDKITVSWSVEVDAMDAVQAANKAHDMLRTNVPIAMTVKLKDGKELDIIPRLEEKIADTIKELIPDADVYVEQTSDGHIEIDTITESFEALPTDDARIEIVNALFQSLPEAIKDKFLYACYTPEEYRDTVDEDYGAEGPED